MALQTSDRSGRACVPWDVGALSHSGYAVFQQART